MITFKAGVRIERPIAEVFAYVTDPLNFPALELGSPSGAQDLRRWRRRLDVRDGTGAPNRSRRQWSRDRDPRAPTGVAIQTTSGPTPFVYRYWFVSENGETVVRLDAAVELEGVAALLGPVVGRAVKRGVDDNFAALKTILEDARV